MANYTGTSGDDVWTGTTGRDQADGRGGNDVLSGGDGTDSLNGGEGDDQLIGGEGIDYLTGGRGSDRVDGGAGNDYIDLDFDGDFAAGDVIEGGAGIDELGIFRSQQQPDYPTVDLSGLSLSGVEGLNVSFSTDVVRMTADQLAMFTSYIYAPHVELTTGGIVTLAQLLQSPDTIKLADAGNNIDLRNVRTSYVIGGGGDDTVVVGTRSSQLYGNGGRDTLTGGSDSDNIAGGDGNDRLGGGDGEDRLTGDAGDDLIVGGAGSDRIVGGIGRDRIDAGDGDDELTINLNDLVADERYDGGAGSDILLINAGGEYDLTSVTTVGIERIRSPYGNVILSSQLLGELTGLAGTFTVRDAAQITYRAASDYTRIYLADGINLFDASGAPGDGRLDVLGGNGSDQIIGRNTTEFFGDFLDGGAGDDTIDGGNGNDTLVGGQGADRVSGGAGDDLLIIGTSETIGAGDRFDGGDGYDVIRSRGGGADLASATLSNVEGIDTDGQIFTITAAQLDAVTALNGSFRVTTGGSISFAGVTSSAENIPQSLLLYLSDAGNSVDMTGFDFVPTNVIGGATGDVITAGAQTAHLYGMGGNDLLRGGDGSDRLDGGTGSDRMSGGAGDDTYVVEAESDRVVEIAGGGHDRVESSASYQILANIEELSLTGNNPIDGTGNDLANLIIGNVAANRVEGRGGNDVLSTGAGTDVLIGGAGADRMTGGFDNDQYSVDDAGDQVIEYADQGYDTVKSSIDYILLDNVEKLILGNGGLSGTGNAIDNLLVGGRGNDTLDGAGGDDTIDGGLGRDRITGGAGADRFLFQLGDTGAAAGDADRITDFSHAEGDKIILRAIDADGVPPDSAFTFIGADAFHNVAGELRYRFIAGGDTLIEGDVNGDGVADLAIRVVGQVALAASDFAL